MVTKTPALIDAPLLLDSLVPDFRFTRLETAAVAAPSGVVFDAARDLDLLSIHSPLFDAVTWVRGMPDKLLNRTPPPLPSMRVADLFDLATKGKQPWLPLGEVPGRELVFGAVGKVWRPSTELSHSAGCTGLAGAHRRRPAQGP
ncbi:hypothetical protein [Actinacidiphila soli]|uniref:hypothetical protein n=1 Tax=Actinacidiphila soli TaxID=2487275 RepID=UPI000FCAE232|nr:hypothetical protein [Actinacidiphila soli]